MADPGGGINQPLESYQPPKAATDQDLDVVADTKDVPSENKNQPEVQKETILHDKQSLKKKEEVVQEYARKLSKIKSRAKLSRRSKDASSSVEGTPETAAKSRISSPLVENFDDVDDISQAKTPKAKSSLLQKKLMENRKIFEQRSREMSENKRVVKEKVEAIRQQLDESDTTILELQKELTTTLPVQPIVITTQVASPGLEHFSLPDRDNRIAELSNKILELEATVLDLQENLKEKDSVINSKTKAITLMTADLSKKRKSTLDTLEDTKDEMRTMQANFVLIETSLKEKINSLLQQLQGRDSRINEYENTVEGLKEDLEKRRVTDVTTADFSRSTLDTLAETKEAMKSMQENFILIESSLKSKNKNLLDQLEEREMKLAETEERIFKLESAAGIVIPPDMKDLQSKLETLEQRNRQLQDEKYELQKSVAELQDKVISNESAVNNGLILEKDNRIAELENLIEELRKSNQLLLEESKTELQNQILELTSKNEEYSNKVDELEKLVHNLESEKNELLKRVPDDSYETKEDARVTKLSKELDDLNKSMIKLKAQHKSKVKSLQKQLENFKKVSDTNAELVKLGNQVTLLEEEKGNLQLSLVDFDELKASAGDWQERISDLEAKISAQSNEIDSQVQAIATLENQKLDLIQELHAVKQEISALEAENADSENLRVTAEMKIVELEEQLDALHKSIADPKQFDLLSESEKKQYLDKIESLSQENNNLIVKLAKLEEKGTSDTGSTESFETLHETDRNELLKKIDMLSQENNDLIIRLTKLEEKTESTECFENLSDSTKNELMKKIELLVKENNSLTTKLSKVEEKSSSDTGSTESFERIPEHGDNLSRLDVLIQENNELVIKVIKLEEKLAEIEESPSHGPKSKTIDDDAMSNLECRVRALTQENADLVIQLTKLQERLGDKFSGNLIQQVESNESMIKERENVLSQENHSLVISVTKLKEKNENLEINLDLVTKERDNLKEAVDQMTTNTFARELIEKLNELNRKNQTTAQGIRDEITKLLHRLTEETVEDKDSVDYQGSVTVTLLENEMENYKKLISEQKVVIDDMKSKLSDTQEELLLQTKKIEDYQTEITNLGKLEMELKNTSSVIKEWELRCEEMEKKLKISESEKVIIEDAIKILEAEKLNMIKEFETKDFEMIKLKKELDETISQFELKCQEEFKIASVREEEITALKELVAKNDADLRDKSGTLQTDMITIDSLHKILNEYKSRIEEQNLTIESLNEEVARLNTSLVTSNAEINNAQATVDKLSAELENSKTSEEFNELVKTLQDSQEITKEMQNKIDEQANEIIMTHGKIENVTSNIRDMAERLAKREEEIAQHTETNKNLNEELHQAKSVESLLTTQISHLHNTLEQNSNYLEDLRQELSNAYRKLELVKAQHVEDREMQNRRLEDLIEELNIKLQENENLKFEIGEKEKLLSQNVTEETKLALELKVADLEGRLMESESKGKAQLDKMKKIAANLKKKVAQCQDLEAKVSDLEEKWNCEKSEKEAINNIIQENEFAIRDKDNKISELENKVIESEKQTAIALQNVEGLAHEIDTFKLRVNSLLEQVTEMGEEIEKLRMEISNRESLLEDEEVKKQNIISEYEAYKLQMQAAYEKQQNSLEETTECARELRVRMEVMESEYVEQLGLIQKLKAENGMLSSKETQINERLENVEKESEERKFLLEKLQKEKTDSTEKVLVHKAQTLDCEMSENAAKPSQEQSYTSVQALEAKLQERDAVIESLEIELGKSHDRVSKLEEALSAVEERRHSLERRTELLGAELEQSFRITEEASFSEDVLEQRLAMLMAKDEAISDKLNETIDENKELTEKIHSLQDINISLQEKIDAVEEELQYSREINEKLQNVDVLYSELLDKHTSQESQMKKIQQDLYEAKQYIDSSEREVTSQINQLDSDKKQLLEKCEKLEDLKVNLIQEIESLKDGVSLCRQRISELEAEVETQNESNQKLVAERAKRKESVSMVGDFPEKVEKLTSLLAEKEVEIENYQRRNMQLQMAAFVTPQQGDVSDVFDTTMLPNTSAPTNEIAMLNNLLAEKIRQYESVCIELENLKQRLANVVSENQQSLNEKDQYYAHLVTESQTLQAEFNQCRNELDRMTEALLEKNQKIDSLHAQFGDICAQLEVSGNHQSDNDKEIVRLTGIITAKDAEIEAIRNELDLANEELQTITTAKKENYSPTDDKNTLIDQLQNEKSIYESQLDDLKVQQKSAQEIVNQIISTAEQKVNKLYEIRDEGNTTNTNDLHKVASTFNELLADFETVKLENDELRLSQESYMNELMELKKHATTDDTNTNDQQVLELKSRVDEITQEKNALLDLLKAQELTINGLKNELDELLIEKESFEHQVSDSIIIINQLKNQQVQVVGNTAEKPISDSTPSQEPVEKNLHLEVDSEWDNRSSGKLDIDEEGWGWSAEEVQLEEQHQLSTTTLTPSAEIQLQTRVAELEDQIKELETKINNLEEESKAIQLKNVKLVKKLKEFKVRNELLEQKVKQQQPSCFSDLDSAIEEELKAQILRLEESLKSAIQEQKKSITEKEQLQKRLEVLTSANERFVEMKERQDMDIEVWQIRNKELTSKIQSLEWQLREISSNHEGSTTPSPQIRSQISVPPSEVDPSSDQLSKTQERIDGLCQQYKEEIDDLKEEMEALATENEQLQQLLEEQKNQMMPVQSKIGSEKSDIIVKYEELAKQNNNLQISLNKLQEEYSLLSKQYKQSLMDANDQVTAMRQLNELMRTELTAKSIEFDNEKQSLIKDTEECTLKINEMQHKLEQTRQENVMLLQKVEILETTNEELSSVSTSLSEVTELLNTRVQEVADLKQNYQQQYLERTETENNLRGNIENLRQELNNKQEEILRLQQSLTQEVSETMQKQGAELHGLQLQLLDKDQEIVKLRNELANVETDAQKCTLELQSHISHIELLEKESQHLKAMLLEKESSLEKTSAELTTCHQESTKNLSLLEYYQSELSKYSSEIERNQQQVHKLENSMIKQIAIADTDRTNLQSQLIDKSEKEQQIEELKVGLREKNSLNECLHQEIKKLSVELHSANDRISQLQTELEEKNVEIQKLNGILIEKEAATEKIRQQLNEGQLQIDSVQLSTSHQQEQGSAQEGVALADSYPRFKMAGDTDIQLLTDVDQLRSELSEKHEEIEQYKYMLSKNTYPELIQKLQDNINQLHTDKYQMEQSLEKKIQLLSEELACKQTEIENIRQATQGQREIVSGDNHEPVVVDQKPSIHQEAIAKLQNVLHDKEQEINELKFVIAQKDSQISLQDNANSQFDEFEIQETLRRLNVDLYTKQQEIEKLQASLVEKEKDINDLTVTKEQSEKDRNLISKLTSEKKLIMEEAEKVLQSKLADKEAEIDELKQRLVIETQELLATLQLKETDVINLRMQMEQSNSHYIDNLRNKDEELLLSKSDLAENERRLAEVSVTKDAEIHNLKVQIHDKDVRIDEMAALMEEEERQLNELRQVVESKEEEIINLKTLLAETVQEYEIIQKSLSRNRSTESAVTPDERKTESADTIDRPLEEGDNLMSHPVVSVEGELDLALYMLHQRDVRCEELTLELMQLLEERDTLQLRLSNAIRINEELRQQKTTMSSPKTEALPSTSSNEPIVEHPSPSRTEGPIEIATDALNVETLPAGEDKSALAQKLSQLHTVHQRRDVRLCDDRESRHTQQMSFVTRRDMLNSLPPEAAARLVNANYTLSRDVQSQSSVLMNWLWGKSTPKVMHM
ncbi:golgin subfamily B member 1 isoform X1 [Neodiprion lecontei]|uniref:Golgin subfamily B member 1 isoform X1 n=1 Tax=Neodiprion lecontei TaxID=441921 RepID=A0A6J0BSS3_NEOLC|nr:golgin subfamily B member 1 isoform X1 [Neodiprion lecontei]